MKKEKQKKDSILKSKFFLNLFGIPYIVLVLLSLTALISDDEEVAMTWIEEIELDIFMLLVWFFISFVISIIVNEIKKIKPKTKIIKEIQYVTKSEAETINKTEVNNSNCLYVCNSKVTSDEYKQMANNSTDIKLHIEFYDDYLIRKGETEIYKIKYSDIDECVETDTSFCLMDNNKNKIIFIKKTFENLKNNFHDNSKYKLNKNYHNPNFIQNGMIILFVVTILCLFGAMQAIPIINQINPQHGFNFTKNLWIMWCFLPIPILSIILGFKYKKEGFKCQKNIVGGFIISFLLLMYGSFCLFPTFSSDYSKIENYKNIIDAELPSNGELEIQEWDTYFDKDKLGYTIINAYYDKEDVSNLVSSIENSNNWILGRELKSIMKIFIPSEFYSDYDSYFSVYNKTTGEYNTLPSTTGNYEIYAMKYDKLNKQLEIHNFKYMYIS